MQGTATGHAGGNAPSPVEVVSKGGPELAQTRRGEARTVITWDRRK